MMRFINLLYWLQAFIAPALLGVLIGIVIGSVKWIIILGVIGAVAGIIIAEYIRRKIGLSNFFGRTYDEADEKIKKKEKDS